MLAPYRKEAGLAPRKPTYPTGTDSTDTWADTTSRLLPSMPLQAARLPKEISDIAKDLRPVAGKPLHFTLATRTENAIPGGELQPFFEIHDSRCMSFR